MSDFPLFNVVVLVLLGLRPSDLNTFSLVIITVPVQLYKVSDFHCI